MDGMEKGRTEPAERPEEAGGDKPAGGPPPQRFSAKMKLRAVSRLQRGEPLELVARELNVTAARLSERRDRAPLAAEAALKERDRDDRDDAIARLKGKVAVREGGRGGADRDVAPGAEPEEPGGRGDRAAHPRARPGTAGLETDPDGRRAGQAGH